MKLTFELRRKNSRFIWIAFTVTPLYFLPGALASPIQTWRENTLRQPVSSSSPNVNWSINTSDQDLEAIAQAAVQQWQDVSSAYITFTQVAPGASDAIQIEVLSSLSNSFAGGQAIATWNADGEITACQIEISDGALSNGDADYAQMLLAHEFGHCLGLGHSIANHAVMSYREPSSTLTADDRFALTVLYPEDGASLPMGCASTALPPKSGGSDQRKESLLLTLLLMGLGMRWLRKKPEIA
jgi:hypothetical protein